MGSLLHACMGPPTIEHQELESLFGGPWLIMEWTSILSLLRGSVGWLLNRLQIADNACQANHAQESFSRGLWQRRRRHGKVP